jgi:ATP-dependent Lon protease
MPAGAVRKDGPSAGLAIAASLFSTFKKIPVKQGIALTGEVTLTGRVLKVGGIREKLLGGIRAGIKEFIIPKSNEPDLEKLPENIRECIRKKEVIVHSVNTVGEMLDLAFPDRTVAEVKKHVKNKK